MNICVLGLRGFPHVMGGVETHCEQLFPRLKSIRPGDSFVVIGRRRYLAGRRVKLFGLEIVALPHAADRRLETITNALCGVFYARFVAHADLLHVQGIGASIAIPIAKLLGMRVIVTYHSKNYEHAKWNWMARALLRSGELFALHLSDHVVSVSAAIEKELIRRFPNAAHKIHFIPNGADHFCPGSELEGIDEHLVRYGLTKGRYVIGVGRLVPEKGFHDLVDAFNAVRHPEYKLVLVGDADHDDGYSRRLRACANDRVIFTGFLPRGCVHALLRDASLFVLPSYNEGMPIAALEAVVAGCPILLSDIEPNRALGFLPDSYFAVGSVASLRDKLSSNHAGCRIDPSSILDCYSWKRASAQMSELYSSMEAELRAGHERRGRQLLGLPSLNWRWGVSAGVDAEPAMDRGVGGRLRHEDAPRH